MNDRALFVFLRILLLVPVYAVSTGCSVHYYDDKTGTEHLWGIGHMKMKIVNASDKTKTQAVLVGLKTVGLRLDLAPTTSGLSLGFDDTRSAIILDSATPLKIQTDSGEPFTLQLGTPPPWAVTSH